MKFWEKNKELVHVLQIDLKDLLAFDEILSQAILMQFFR